MNVVVGVMSVENGYSLLVLVIAIVNIGMEVVQRVNNDPFVL